MSWNYRVVKRVYTYKDLHEPETLYELTEVFYDENGDISGMAEKGDVISESVEGLKWTLDQMIKACDKSVIDYHTGEEIDEV